MKKLIIAVVIILVVCVLAMCGEQNADAASYCAYMLSNLELVL